MNEEQYKEYIKRFTAEDFSRAFRDNSDQSDVQLVADYLRKIELNEKVVSAVVQLMYENQSNWSTNDEKLIESLKDIEN